MESLFIQRSFFVQISIWKKMTLMTDFVVQGHIYIFLLYNILIIIL